MRLYTLLVCFTLMVGACGTPDGLLAGGIKEETREKAAVAARFALEQVAAREARVGALSLVGVLKARRQVVAGNMWYLMIAAEDEQQQQLSFEAAVYESLPLGTANMKLTAYRQVIGDTEGMVPGEVHPVDEQGEGVQAAAAFTAKEASGMSNSLAPWSVASVDDSRVQVGTSGLAYELKLTLARREEVQAVQARVERSVDGQLQILNLSRAQGAVGAAIHMRGESSRFWA